MSWRRWGLAFALASACGWAHAAGLGGAAGTLGLIGPIVVVLFVRGWQAGLDSGGLPLVVVATLVGFGAWWWRPGRMRPARSIVPQSGACAPAVHRTSAPHSESLLHSRLPEGVNGELLSVELSRHFVRFQAAWDAYDAPSLREMTTPAMFQELSAGLQHSEAPADVTQVMTLQTEILCFEVLDSAHLISVEFRGLMRESTESGASHFREVWMLTKSNTHESTWKLARQQTLL